MANSDCQQSCSAIIQLFSFELKQRWREASSKLCTFYYQIILLFLTEMESLRTSLASRTHFEVLGFGLEGQALGLGLGLEASSPRKLSCPRLMSSFCPQQMRNFLVVVQLEKSSLLQFCDAGNQHKSF